jgi:hypothetical protein
MANTAALEVLYLLRLPHTYNINNPTWRVIYEVWGMSCGYFLERNTET